MKQAITGLFGSKKAIVYVVTVGVMVAVMFGGVDSDQAADFIDKLSKLAMAYLGGQGLADLGKYAGDAFSSGKKAVAERDKDLSNWNERASEAGEAAESAADTAGDVVDKVAGSESAAASTTPVLPAPPTVGGE